MLNSFSLSNISSTPDLVFWICAIFGSTLFVLRVVAGLFFALDDGDALEHEHESFNNHDIHASEGNHHTGYWFKFFSLHSITGFLMMFGWVGLACTKQFGYGHSKALVIACCGGIVTMIVVVMLFKGASLLASPGTTFRAEKTIGLIGSVYQKIPANGFGKIQIDVDGVTREVLARASNDKAIDSFCRVKIIATLDQEAVIVEKVN